MRYISKEARNSPQEFETWKMQDKPEKWADFPSSLPQTYEEGVSYYCKEQLREALLTEQGYLCCYCQQRLENTSRTIIEHLKPKSDPAFRHLTFDYTNLFACCSGIDANEPSNTQPTFCGHRKDQSILALEPSQPDCESFFQYQFNFDLDLPQVKISTTHLAEDKRHTVENLLGLNEAKLQNMRGAVLKGLLYDENNLISEDIMKFILENLEDHLTQIPNIHLQPFHLAQIQILKQFV